MTARFIAPVVMGLVMLVLWEAVVRLAEIPPYVLPSPLVVARTVVTDWGNSFSIKRVGKINELIQLIRNFTMPIYI
ncbi:MAG: hypothetical protein HYZ40_04720 [Rhodospirillales bacterium]|nr:hypothetical protein [Rhodospirillales bacterium]